MTRRAIAALVASAACVLAGPLAVRAAAPGKLLTSSAVSRLVSDGTRFAAYQPGLGTLRVLDSRTGAWREMPIPAGCDTRFDQGGPVAIGGGVALLECGQSGYWPSAQVLDLGTGAVVGRIGASQLDGRLDSSILDSEWSAVGSTWALLTYSGNHYSGQAAVNWRTGLVRDLGPASDPGPATSALDLDAPGLFRPLCAPLRRLPWQDPQWSTDRYLPLLYEAPFAAGPARFDGTLTVRRCGSSVGETISPGALSLQLGAGLLSFVPNAFNGGRPAVAYDPARRALYRWTGMQQGTLAPLSVAHTAGSVFISSWLSQPTGGGGTIPTVGTYAIRAVARPRLSPAADPRGRLRLGRRPVPLLRLTFADPGSGAEVTYRPTGGDTRALRLRSGASLALTPARSARVLRWRLLDARGRGVSAVHAARRSGARWTVTLPRRIPARAAALLLDLGYRAPGGRALFTQRVRIAPARNARR